jgi:HAD superfamily hydrolase (TIGR01509 family)
MFELFKDFKIAIFDLDGTVVLTNDLWREAITETLNNATIPPTDVEELYVPGTPLDSFFEDYVVNIDNKVKDYLIGETVKHYKQQLAGTEIEVAEGLVSFLVFLQKNGTRIALVSNSEREIVNTVLENIGYESVFEFSICGDEVKNKKPDPEMYNAVLKYYKELKVPKEQIVVFEDSPAGAQGAIKAGLYPLIVSNEEIKSLLYPDEIRGFSDNFTNLDYSVNQDFIEQLRQEVENQRRELQTNPQTQP